MRWSWGTDANARCKRVSIGCGRKRRSMRVLHWICGVRPVLKAVNKPSPHFIVHVLDKPGSSATVSKIKAAFGSWSDLDAEELIANIYRWREEDSRPAT